MLCLLEDARQLLVQSCSGDLAWQRSLVITLSLGRQGAFRHNW